MEVEDPNATRPYTAEITWLVGDALYVHTSVWNEGNEAKCKKTRDMVQETLPQVG